MILCLAVSAVLVAGAGPAASESTAINGFVTSAAGELRGTVTDADGAPAPNTVVHVIPAGGTPIQVRTDRQGAYRVKLAGGESHVFIDVPGRVIGSVVSGDDGVIEVRDITPPAVEAKPKKKPAFIPPYTEAAIDADVWTRAWLLLHVDARGVVTHIKLVSDPGHGLAEGAVKHAFTLAFSPALDRVKRPTRSLVLWTYEWPSHSWIRKGAHSEARLPDEVARVTCRASRRHRAIERDCSKPDLAAAAKRPWIARRMP